MRRRHGRTRREREGGFALLLVFVMAAVIGITLYMELPRLAFQVQRQKEQMLMERGQQYQLAIRRYMQRGLKQGVNQVVGPPWPARIEDLENTNGRRFLRKRYIDPMTGTDEWRIIHINNGVLTDSVNNKQQKNQQQEPLRTSGITEFASIGQAPAASSGVGQMQTRRRASDNAGSSGGGGFDPNAPGAAGDNGGASALPGGSPGVLPVPIPLPVMPQMGAGGNLGRSGAFGSSMPPGLPPGFAPGMPPGMIPGVPPGQPPFPGQLGNPVNSNNTGDSPYPTTQGSSGNSPFFQPPGTTMGGQPSPQALIGALLTQPRPGGMPTAVPNTNSTLGGGIAGIASKLDDDSIMVCGDHSNYNEWEFIFDPSKWRGPADPRKALVGTPAGNSPAGGNPPANPTAGPGGGAPGGAIPGQSPGQNQNRAGTQGGNLGTICGMEARPGIQ